MTIKQITEKILEIEKRYDVVVYFTYETFMKHYVIRMVYKGLNYSKGILIDEIHGWDIVDFEAVLEEMVDELFKSKRSWSD